MKELKKDVLKRGGVCFEKDEDSRKSETLGVNDKTFSMKNQ